MDGRNARDIACMVLNMSESGAKIAVAAAGSVGETIAPRAKETAQGRPITWWATTPTTAAVANVRPIAFRVMTLASERRARRS